jgi:hypothetical protein
MRLSFLFAACSKICLLGLYLQWLDLIRSWLERCVYKYLYCMAQFNAGNMHGVLGFYRRKIRIIEGNAKCRHLKNWPVKGLCGRCLSVWGPERNTLHPLHTVRVCSTYSHREGGRGGELNQRTGERRNSSQSWVENTNMTDCMSSL